MLWCEWLHRAVFRQSDGVRTVPPMHERQAPDSEVWQVGNRVAKSFLHFIKAGNVSFFDGHSLRCDVAHSHHHEAILGKNIHGAFFTLGVGIFNGRKVALVKLM